MFSSFRGLKEGDMNGFLLFQLFGIWGVLFFLREEVGDRIREEGSRFGGGTDIPQYHRYFQVTVFCLQAWL